MITIIFRFNMGSHDGVTRSRSWACNAMEKAYCHR